MTIGYFVNYYTLSMYKKKQLPKTAALIVNHYSYNPIDTTRPWKALVNSSVHCLLVNTNNSNDQYGTLNGLWPSTYCFTLLLSIVVCYLFAGLSPFISTFYNISP
ncbi:hypothetical protein DERF_014792 [Dermatophagoides farinae]|uniref:Uncharacterized protein n=1 Tax=Dermatophagoides farinae TaxID=6954 RepID=A0A922HJJ5_DERFA|nr:hypothetical protein DERF_014792 [Dermatophagoides farinae]